MKQKLIFIGNSIVNGFPYSRGRSFPGLIRAAISEQRAGFSANVINKGANGETTAQILARFDHDVLDHQPAAACIMTGTNDFIYREAAPDQCLQNLEHMAAKAGQAGIIPVYMTPIFVDPVKAERQWMAGLGIDYEDINRQIQDFADGIRQSGRLVIDLNQAYSDFTGSLEDPGQAYLDGVHPTAEGYQLLAETTMDWIREHASQIRL